MVLPTWEPEGYSTPRTDAALREIEGVGANWVQIVPTWYQVTNSASDIAPTAGGPDDDSVRRAISAAHEQGLKVLLKPHVDLLDRTDRAAVRPRDPDAWFASYTAFIGHYAELAADLDVDEFAVGTELRGVARDRARWIKVIDTVRHRYSGPLVYAANPNAYAEVSFWDKVDLIGIDGYWPLSRKPTTDVAELTRSLAPIRDQLAAFSARTGRRVLFTEVGYASQRGATTQPASSKLSRQQAQDEQAAAYRAVLEVFTCQAWWAGVYWWVWTVLPVPPAHPPEPLGYSVHGKEAEAVVRKWWAH
jgi:hypothetical protein